jgi:hypothetical protein
MGYMKSLLAYRTDDAAEQRRLMQLLRDVTEGRTNDGELKKFLDQHNWPKPEMARRLTHALAKMKTQRVELYPYARELAERVYTGP